MARNLRDRERRDGRRRRRAKTQRSQKGVDATGGGQRFRAATPAASTDSPACANCGASTRRKTCPSCGACPRCGEYPSAVSGSSSRSRCPCR